MKRILALLVFVFSLPLSAMDLQLSPNTGPLQILGFSTVVAHQGNTVFQRLLNHTMAQSAEYAQVPLAGEDENPETIKALLDVVEHNPHLRTIVPDSLYDEPTAQCALADLFYDQELSRINNWLATYWYRQAALQNDAEGIYNLALMYDEDRAIITLDDQTVPVYLGQDITVLSRGQTNQEKALELFAHAAELNHADAQCRLGHYYKNVVNNEEEAFAWYETAAANGCSEAQEIVDNT